jgi:RecA-family ATPase
LSNAILDEVVQAPSAASTDNAPASRATPSTPHAAAVSAHGFVTLDELERICREQPTNYIVEGLLPADDVHVAVGDSGLGKTPWAYQLGLCVATGEPFLGFPVRQGRVLYYDLENGREEIIQVGRSLRGHLGISAFPSDFLVLHDQGNPTWLPTAVEAHSPILAIVDTLRAYRPMAQKSNEDMAAFLKDCKRSARQKHCAILFFHRSSMPNNHFQQLYRSQRAMGRTV